MNKAIDIISRKIIKLGMELEDSMYSDDRHTASRCLVEIAVLKEVWDELT